MRRWLLPFCLTLSAVACGDLQSGQAGAPPSATPTSASAPAADCVALGAISPIPVPPLAVVDLGDGTKRVTSAEAGYSLVVPGTWLVSGAIAGTVNPWFGQGHMSSYDPRAAPTPRPEAGTILPPEVGVRLDIEMWANPLREPLDIYAQRVHIGPDQIAVLPGAFVRLAGGQAYRMTIQDERRFQPSLGPLVATRQTRAVWLVPSPRADRVLVLYATPAESALFPAVERAVSTLQVAAPRSAVLPVVHQRSEILQRWLVGKSGPIAGRRAEAKLMTYAEASLAMDARPGASPNPPLPMGIPRIDRDPDELFWLVAVSGPDLPASRGGPPGRGVAVGTPAPTAWILYDTPATNDRGERTGQGFSTAGTWPPGFDTLPDRCH